MVFEISAQVNDSDGSITKRKKNFVIFYKGVYVDKNILKREKWKILRRPLVPLKSVS